MRTKRYQLSGLLTTILSSFKNLLFCSALPANNWDKSGISEFPRKGLKISSDREQEAQKYLSGEHQLFRDCYLMLGAAAGAVSTMHLLALRQVCVLLGKCLGGTDLNKMLSNVLEPCHDLEYQLGISQHNSSQTFYSREIFFPPSDISSWEIHL